MKIRPLTPENHPKAIALLRSAFPKSRLETRLFENLHHNKRHIHEWVCIHRHRFIAYIAFTRAYDNNLPCGLHLAPMAVAPEWQNRSIGSELINFSLRQREIRNETIFVLGPPEFYKKFGFTPCASPICPFDENNKHFLSLRNPQEHNYTVGYEPEFFK